MNDTWLAVLYERQLFECNVPISNRYYIALGQTCELTVMYVAARLLTVLRLLGPIQVTQNTAPSGDRSCIMHLSDSSVPVLLCDAEVH